MPQVEIERDTACRGCRACIDICPVQVFERGLSARGEPVAKVINAANCVGCFSCYYKCPSQCIRISGVERQRPFHRIDENVGLVRNFVQIEPLADELTEADWEQAYQDVSMTLLELSKSIENVFGFGTAAIAFQSGQLAAPHFPELYEINTLEERLQRLQQRLRHSFDFDYKINDNGIAFVFKPCGICAIVKTANEPIIESIICRLFHEYWSGLVGNLSDTEYRVEVTNNGNICHLNLLR
jgi:NAD-dependent dihydropyrimidine dehydrogenase PreA subunit